jgi:hypothetical protein
MNFIPLKWRFCLIKSLMRRKVPFSFLRAVRCITRTFPFWSWDQFSTSQNPKSRSPCFCPDEITPGKNCLFALEKLNIGKFVLLNDRIHPVGCQRSCSVDRNRITPDFNFKYLKKSPKWGMYLIKIRAKLIQDFELSCIKGRGNIIRIRSLWP